MSEDAALFDKGLPIRHVAAVDVKKPGAFDGYIHFSIAGGRPHDSALDVPCAPT